MWNVLQMSVLVIPRKKHFRIQNTIHVTYSIGLPSLHLSLTWSQLLNQCLNRFMRELRELKASSEYSSCDPSKLDDWLKEVSPDLSQYTYQLLLSGVDRLFLPQISEELLRDDCGVSNGIHRARILQRIRGEVLLTNMCKGLP